MKGVTSDRSRGARRFRRNLPTTRRQPQVVTVLQDVVNLAKGEVDKLAVKAKGPDGLSGGDLERLERLVNTLDRAQRTEARIEEELRGDLVGADEAELAELAEGGGESE